jgi:hypothetical protein
MSCSLPGIGFFLSLLLLATGNRASAQIRPADRGEFRIGAIAGLNWNYVDIGAQEFIEAPEGSTMPTYSFIRSQGFAPFVGLQADYDLNRVLGLHARITYDGRNISNDRSGGQLNARLSYLTLEPGLRLTNSPQSRIFLMAGPSLHFNIGHSYDFTPAYPEDPSVHDAEIEYVNTVAYGLWLSIGMDVPFGIEPGGAGWYIAPFIEASYLFDQIAYEEGEVDPVPNQGAEEEYHEWGTITFRSGIGVKYSFGM